jgi:putative transposase
MGLGVEPITGKPYKPTTQGKNERFHQTLFRYLDKQPLAASLADLQAQVDAFDHIYNTDRPHQGLPGRVTPLVAWEATTKAEAPRPTRARFPKPTGPRSRPTTVPMPEDRPEDTQIKKLTTAGTFRLAGVHYKGRRTTRTRAGPDHHRRRHDHRRRPARRDPHRTHPPRTRRDLRRQRQTPRPAPQPTQSVTDVLRHELSPMS